MSDLPNNPAEFYRIRDDRTSRYGVTSEYQQTHCAVFISPEQVNTLTGQTMLLASCNLLSRWCRHVTIIGRFAPAHNALVKKSSSLKEIVLEQMHTADPFGHYSWVEDEANLPKESLVLVIGETANRDLVSPIFINASGWLASISMASGVSLTGGNDQNNLGAISAACLGVAEIFKISINRHFEFEPQIFDLFSLSYVEGTVDSHPYAVDENIGNILMVGAGSVGSAVAFCLRLTNARCELTVIDNDVVKLENLNRSPIFDTEYVKLNKAVAVAKYCDGTNVKVTPFVGWWNDFLAKNPRGNFPFDVWLPLANEHGVRHAMQHNVPPIMIHASTTANWGVNHARHIPGQDDCLIDRFPELVPQNQLICSTGNIIREKETNIDAALPFLSVFGGLLVVADLFRLLTPQYPQVPNFGLFDFGGALMTLQKFDKKPAEHCHCRQQNKTLHTAFNARTKYWSVFRPKA